MIFLKLSLPDFLMIAKLFHGLKKKNFSLSDFPIWYLNVCQTFHELRNPFLIHTSRELDRILGERSSLTVFIMRFWSIRHRLPRRTINTAHWCKPPGIGRKCLISQALPRISQYQILPKSLANVCQTFLVDTHMAGLVRYVPIQPKNTWHTILGPVFGLHPPAQTHVAKFGKIPREASKNVVWASRVLGNVRDWK